MDTPIAGTAYSIDSELAAHCKELAIRVAEMRRVGRLSPEVLSNLRRYFRIKNIYNSNAIEGNQLNVGETRLVVEQGLTISGKPLRDQAEARNLSDALDFLEELAQDHDRPISETDVRQLHFLVLKGIQDADAGNYRQSDVEISGSAYKPPHHSFVAAQMEDFGRWLHEASVPGKLFQPEEAIIAASAAHTWFVTIHPFVDGNGRTARLLLNVILMRFGYPISIVTHDDRLRYYDALEVSQTSDLSALISLVVENVEESLEEYQAAADEQQAGQEWAKSIAAQLAKKEIASASNQYEVWKNAMELFKSQFKQLVELIDNSTPFADIYFTDFGVIEFEKYASLRNMSSAKKTWFFRVDFRSGERSQRYLFFFGFPSLAMKGSADVTLQISRESPPGSFRYVRLDDLSSPDTPTIREIGYQAAKEDFVWRGPSGKITAGKVEGLIQRFVQEVVDRNFGS